ncbi:MAG: response regulator [Alphaproteobacteria bacterium]|nr:response regulator [Alphaproteobacteria bacterium]
MGVEPNGASGAGWRFLQLPDLGDEDRNRSARILDALLLIGTTGMVLALVGTTLVSPSEAWSGMRWYGPALVSNIACLVAIRLGQARGVGIYYLGSAYLIIVGGAVVNGGFGGVFPWFLTFSLVLASVLFGTRGILAALVATTVGALVIAAADARGWSSPAPSEQHLLIPFLLLQGLVGGVLTLAGRLLQSALDDARAARDEARLSRQAVDDVLQVMAEPLVCVGDDGIVQRANPAMTSLVGREDLVGSSVETLFRATPTEGETVIYDVDGHPIAVAASKGVIPGLAVWVLKDVRHRREAERRLRAAAEAAEAANRSKSQFLANMSHELRTPLNAIIGYSEMLREDARDRAARQDLGRIEGAGRHLLALINDILDLSKIEAGRMEIHRERFDVAATCRELAQIVAPQLERGQNRLVLDLPPDLGTMSSDVIRVRQVLLNLLSNAAKFTTSGEIRLGARRQGEVVSFSVADTGIGISPEALARLFQPFMQADGSTTRRFGGTGLGLALVRHFAHLLGGDVSVQSTVGKGSTFTVTLPDTTASYPGAEQAIAEMPRPEGVLVVCIDDDPMVHEIVTRTLESRGIRVVSARSGEEGIELARQLRPNAITLDVMMPGMDGWEVLEALKQDEATRDVPVAMLTIVDHAERGRALGASAWLLKPVDRRTLVSVVQSMVTFAGDVLVVDDDDALRELAVRVLTDLGRSVRQARHGGEALERMREHLPGLVLLDLMMPELDGFGVLEAMRSDPELSSIPVVVLSAADLSSEDRARLSHATRILAKGADPRGAIAEALFRTPTGVERSPARQEA